MGVHRRYNLRCSKCYDFASCVTNRVRRYDGSLEVDKGLYINVRVTKRVGNLCTVVCNRCGYSYKTTSQAAHRRVPISGDWQEGMNSGTTQGQG